MLNKTKAVPSDLYTGYMLAHYKMNIYNYLMCKQLVRKITLELLSRYIVISLLECNKKVNLVLNSDSQT